MGFYDSLKSGGDVPSDHELKSEIESTLRRIFEALEIPPSKWAPIVVTPSDLAAGQRLLQGSNTIVKQPDDIVWSRGRLTLPDGGVIPLEVIRYNTPHFIEFAGIPHMGTTTFEQFIAQIAESLKTKADRAKRG